MNTLPIVSNFNVVFVVDAQRSVPSFGVPHPSLVPQLELLFLALLFNTKEQGRFPFDVVFELVLPREGAGQRPPGDGGSGGR